MKVKTDKNNLKSTGGGGKQNWFQGAVSVAAQKWGVSRGYSVLV